MLAYKSGLRELTPPRRGRRPPFPTLIWRFGPIPWTRHQAWRFKRACYARGKPAFAVVRELMEAYIETFEAEQPK